MDKPFDEYTKQVEEARAAFYTEVDRIAGRVREEVVIPVCKKHGLTFSSGNGTFDFAKGKGMYSEGRLLYSDGKVFPSSVRGAPSALRADLDPIIDLLDTEVSEKGTLGCWVADVTRGDAAPDSPYFPTLTPHPLDVTLNMDLARHVERLAQSADLGTFSTQREVRNREEVRAKLNPYSWKDRQCRLSPSDACCLLEEASFHPGSTRPDVQIFLRDLARSNPFKESPGPTAPRVRFPSNAAKAGLRGQRDHDYPKLLERRELFLQEDLRLLGDTGKFIPHLLGAYTLSESSFWVHADEWRRLSTVETRHLLALRVLDEKVGRGRVRAVLRGFGVKTAEIRRSLRQLLADWARISVLPRGIPRAEIYPLQRMLRSMEEEKIATALDEYSLGLDASLLTQFSRAEFHVLAQAADLLRLPCAQLFLSLENQLGEHNV